MVRQEGCNAQVLVICFLGAAVDYSTSMLGADGRCMANLTLVAVVEGAVKQRAARADAQVL